jgi:tetratricopeptide (TPR) repeat protein
MTESKKQMTKAPHPRSDAGIGPARLELPPAPAAETGAVKAWEQPVTMRSYLPAPPDPNPLFLEKRVYQGSSGRVYPLPVIDRIDTEPRDHAWRAVHLENEFLRLMVLPEIGGRIHVGYDKTGNYDFIYRQNVIKPALVGLAGPWVSGGVEFNWPQHHRPATFMPVEVSIERATDGSVTVWCSDYDPLSRLKGMHGLCLRPGKAYLELKVRLYNRTCDTQTFLWWANVAVHVHEKYQSFFPGDVRFVADHAKRAITEFPLSQGRYYGVDYGKRPANGVAGEERPTCFVPDGSYPPNDLSWYANIPVPTSYMVAESKGDFAGGYDHQRQAGLVYFANRRIAPGKKQWTWGNNEFGYAWDRSLTDADGPYIELMAGAYTDNQPDFSFLAPGETKTFSQFWYPIREIGVPDFATLDAALRLERKDEAILIHLMATRSLPQSVLRIAAKGKQIAFRPLDLQPASPVCVEFAVPAGTAGTGADIEATLDCDGETVLRYAPGKVVSAPAPAVATEPPQPGQVESNDQLYLIGLHLEQYRHATRGPEPYWREAVRRDTGDSRANGALGRWHMRRGELEAAEAHLRAAIARLSERNPNPYDGEPHYNLGMVLQMQRRPEEAYDAFYKSTWSAAWRGPAYHRLAEIDCAKGTWVQALDHIDRSLRADVDNLNGRNLKAVILRRLGREDEARELIAATLALDPLEVLTRYLETGQAPKNGQQRLDLTFDLARAGLLDDAVQVLTAPGAETGDGSGAMILYALGWIYERADRKQESRDAYQRATEADPRYVFPSRLEEILLLEEAIAANPQDAPARYYLGNLLYDRRRREEAIERWEAAAALDPQFPTVWRNLGFAYYNVRRDTEKARDAFAQATKLAPDDARILYEQDQLLKRTGELPAHRLTHLRSARALVGRRDDLSVEFAELCNQMGRPAEALEVLLARKFQPWEGGEGLVLAQYTRAHMQLGREVLRKRQPRAAAAHFAAALHPPASLGEAWHPLANRGAVEYWLGVAHEALGEADEARRHWSRAASSDGDFVRMQVRAISEASFWSGMALDRLGETEKAANLFQTMFDYSLQLERETPDIDYFATSLPAMLLFEEDLARRQSISAVFLRAQALVGMGEVKRALAFIEAVEQLDHNHSGAAELRAGIEEAALRRTTGNAMPF